MQKQVWDSLSHQLSQTHLKAFELSTIQSRWEAAMPDQQRDWMVDNSKAFK